MKKIEELIMELEMAIERFDDVSAEAYLSQAKNELSRLCKLSDKESKKLFNENCMKVRNLEIILHS